MAPSILDIILRAKNQASKELNQVTSQLKGMDKAAKFAVGGLSAVAGGFAAMQAARFAADMAKLNTQTERSAFAFEHFSGGVDQAAANMRAVQRAAGGMLTSLDAQNLAVTAMTQGLADNSVELERITRIARGIVAVSPIINDLETAFSQLGLTIANQSLMRLDQLGTSAAELKPKIEALKAANKNLTDEQAFQAALLGTLETKFNALTDAAVNQASGLERLAVAWGDYRNSAAGAFKFVDVLAGNLANALDQQTKFDFGQWLADQMGDPDFMGTLTYAQKKIVSKLKEITDLSYLDKLGMGDQYTQQIADLVDQYFKLADAAARTAQVFDQNMNVLDPSKIQGPNLPTFFTGQDWTNWTAKVEADAEAAKEAIDEIIEAQARAIEAQSFDQTGDVQKSAAIYAGVVEQLNAWVAKQKRANVEVATIINLLPQVAAGMIWVQDSVDDIDDEPVNRLADAMDSLGGYVRTAAADMLTFARNSVSAQSAALNMAGAINAAYDAVQKTNGGPLGLSSGQKREAGKSDPQKELKQINSEAAAAARSVAGVNSEFESLKSTISGIVTGAIGPVAGVDANDLLPRPDAVNENARRLADIAVNGLKGQDWLGEFAAEVPGIWDEIANSGDPQGTAARILKDFQDGLRPELLDKERAKELVKRALQGDANTKQLVDEIAADLANELGISLSQAKEAASSVLGGGTEAGATGVSLSPKIDSGAASSAAVSFSAAFVGAIESGSLGADLGAALMVQVAGSVAMVEQTGKDAGDVFVRGFTGSFDGIPAAFVAAVVSLAMPGIMANMSSNGGRTGAADV